jgi:putative phosphoribosyl transferase
MAERTVSKELRTYRRVTRVTIARDHISLSAVLITPGQNGPFPCVVFVHGLGSGKDSPRNVVIAEHLVDAGIAAFLFDLSGHGESSPDPRGQDPQAYVDDTVASMRWLRGRPELRSHAIGLSGSSMGAVVAVAAVQQGLATPAAMVLRAPPIRPDDLDEIGTPTLVVVGSEDPLLPEINAAVRSHPVALSVVPGAGHLFEEPGTLERALDLTVEWFVSHLLK